VPPRPRDSTRNEARCRWIGWWKSEPRRQISASPSRGDATGRVAADLFADLAADRVALRDLLAAFLGDKPGNAD